jgi:hypothetical protein
MDLDPAPTIKKKPNKGKRLKKQKVMKTNPESLICDYGGDIEFGSFDKRYGMGVTPADAQFFTTRSTQWLEALTDHFHDLYNKKEIPTPPEVFNTGNGPQIKVKNINTEHNDNYITIYLYNTGTTLIQGQYFEKWCQQYFYKLKQRMDKACSSNYFTPQVLSGKRQCTGDNDTQAQMEEIPFGEYNLQVKFPDDNLKLNKNDIHELIPVYIRITF